MSGLVSVIMPNYNSEKYVDEAVQSVLNQTYTDWELLIVDDCSTDGSVNIIKQYAAKDSRIKLFINEENRGAAYSRNFALREAKGKWVAFLDSDDKWTTDKLERQIEFMLANGYGFSYTEYEQIDEESAPLGKIITGPETITRRKMYHYNYIGCSTVVYDRETVGLLQIKDEVGNGRNDYALWLKAAKICECFLLKETLAEYRLRKQSLSHGKFFKLIKYHYELFRISEDMGRLRAAYHTAVNLFYGFFKKIKYVKKP